MYGGSKISDAKWYHSKNMSKLVQINMIRIVTIQYDSNCYDSYDSQTCLNLFRFKMMWIVTIQYDTNCYDSYDSQTFLNMFKPV